MTRPAPAQRSDFKHWARFSTRWGDNDAYGHVNNTVYYEWFDSAVNGWLIEQGFLDIAAGNPIGLVVETRCSYFAPLVYPQEVDVGIAAEAFGRTSIRYRIGVFAHDSAVAAAQGEFVHVIVDRGSRKPVEIPSGWRSALEAIS